MVKSISIDFKYENVHFDNPTYSIVDICPKLGEYEWYIVYVAFSIRTGFGRESYCNIEREVLCRRKTNKIGDILNFDSEVADILSDMIHIQSSMKGLFQAFIKLFRKWLCKIDDYIYTYDVSIFKIKNPNCVYRDEQQRESEKDGYYECAWYAGNDEVLSMPYYDRVKFITNYYPFVGYDFGSDGILKGIKKSDDCFIDSKYISSFMDMDKTYRRKFDPGDIVAFKEFINDDYYEFVSICPDNTVFSCIDWSNMYSTTLLDGYDTCEYSLEDAVIVSKAKKGQILYGCEINLNLSRPIHYITNNFIYSRKHKMVILNKYSSITPDLISKCKNSAIEKFKNNMVRDHKILNKFFKITHISSLIYHILEKSGMVEITNRSVEYCNADMWKPNKYSSVLMKYGFPHKFNYRTDQEEADEFIKSLDSSTRLKLINELMVTTAAVYDDNGNEIDRIDYYQRFTKRKRSDYNL